jgi:zona occludens toxin (predicted ATPase)
LSPCNYTPAGHIITGDVEIVENENLKSLIRKRHEFKDPWSFSRRKNFIFIMNVVKDFAKRWAKRENEELDTLSE